MHNIPKNLIIDVIPAYLADDVSDETRTIVEKFAAQDKEIAEMLKDDLSGKVIDKSYMIPSEQLEFETISRAKRSLRRKMILVAIVTASVLLVPLTTMNFANGATWDLLDFIVMGTLLSATGFTIALASQKLTKSHFKIIATSAVICFLWLWAEITVGIFTNWGS